MSNSSVSAFASLRGYRVIRPAELCIILVKKSIVAFVAKPLKLGPLRQSSVSSSNEETRRNSIAGKLKCS